MIKVLILLTIIKCKKQNIPKSIPKKFYDTNILTPRAISHLPQIRLELFPPTHSATVRNFSETPAILEETQTHGLEFFKYRDFW